MGRDRLEICEEAHTGNFDIGSEDCQREWLECDSVKMVEGYYYEHHFEKELLRWFGKDRVSTGWSYVAHTQKAGGHPKCFYKAFAYEDTQGSMSKADHAVRLWLEEIGMPWIFIRYKPGEGFQAMWKKQPWKNVREIMKEHPTTTDYEVTRFDADWDQKHRRSKVEEEKGRTATDEWAAIEHFISRLPDKARRDVMINRLSHVGLILRWNGYLPMDIDAFIIARKPGTEDYAVEWIEMKRVNPGTEHKAFRETRKTKMQLEWLKTVGKTRHQVMWCDPLWSANKPPTHLFRKELFLHWRTIYFPMTLDTVEGAEESKLPDGYQGANQIGGKRPDPTVFHIPWDHCQCIMYGITLECLEGVIGGEIVQDTSYEELEKTHRFFIEKYKELT